MICIAAQILYELLKGVLEDVVDSSKEKDVLMSDDMPTRKITLLGVEENALYNVKATDVYHKDLIGKLVYHLSVSGCAILCWQKELQGSVMSQGLH